MLVHMNFNASCYRNSINPRVHSIDVDRNTALYRFDAIISCLQRVPDNMVRCNKSILGLGVYRKRHLDATVDDRSVLERVGPTVIGEPDLCPRCIDIAASKGDGPHAFQYYIVYMRFCHECIDCS